MTEAYFQQLNTTLKAYKRAVPSLLIDLDQLDKNIRELKKMIAPGKAFRIVVKSLPAIPLLDYIMEQTGTHKLMVFHEPFLLALAQHYGDAVDLLMGKPMPVQTARHFYLTLDKATSFRPERQLQWLIDTEERLQQYLALARAHKTCLRINLELDIGLHRGGFKELTSLRRALQLIQQHPDQLQFSGFMGYDPHVALLPKLVRPASKSFRLANAYYQKCIDLVHDDFPALWHEQLTFNGAGSPTLAFHQEEASVLNDIAVGSALVKPASFDLPSLAQFQAACFIATPILKKLQGTKLPGLEKWTRLLAFCRPKLRQSYFIYGGYWKAEYCYPPKTSENQLFGSSTNQSMINTAANTSLEVDDFVFLRPKQSEFVLLQFGALLAVRDFEVLAEWPVLPVV